MLPYEENRVRLTPTRDNRMGYINASHISAAIGTSQRFYIAAQGPLPCTVADFWQTVWHCDVYVIVMLADLGPSSASVKQIPAVKSTVPLRSQVSNSSINGYTGMVYWPQLDAGSLEFGEVCFKVVNSCSDFYRILSTVQNYSTIWKPEPSAFNYEAGRYSRTNWTATQYLALAVFGVDRERLSQRRFTLPKYAN